VDASALMEPRPHGVLAEYLEINVALISGGLGTAGGGPAKGLRHIGR
jgi:hypothetical protein